MLAGENIRWSFEQSHHAEITPFSAMLERAAQLVRGSVNEEERTAMVAFSSEAFVARDDFDEVLSHDPADADLSQIQGAPVLRNHDVAQHIGAVVKGSIDRDRKGRAKIRFSRSKLGQEAMQDAKDGILTAASVGYEIIRQISEKTLSTGRKVKRFAWRFLELSLVPIAADPSCGLGRARTKITMNNEESEDSNGGDQLPDRHERRAEMARARDIGATVDIIVPTAPHLADQIRHMGARAISAGMPISDFKAKLCALIGDNVPQNQFTRVDERIGMTQHQIDRYSIVRAIRSWAEKGRLEGIELEMHQECERRSGNASGFWWPVDIPAATMTRSSRQQRDLNVGTFSQGGAFVGTDIISVVEILRNKMVTQRLGVKTMGGLSGNVAIPRQTASATAYSLPESGTLTKSNQVIDQIPLVPKRVGAYEEYSKLLLLQSSNDVEQFVRDDLTKVVAVKWDYMTLEGAGAASEPLGIMNTPGIASVAFGGTTTWAKAIAFETALAVANADDGRMAYVTTPSVRAAWKNIPKIAASTVPIFIWEKGDWNDGSNDGEVNLYRSACTNQIANNSVVFGNWNDVILAMWGGMDIVVNPYVRDIDAMIRVTVNTFGDVALRHAASFAWSADPGNL